jgi:MoxR-like ATPase
MIIRLQRLASEVFVHNLVAEYIVRLVLATRTPAEFNLPDLTSVIQIGCSPRATLGLVAAARALALIHGRDYVLPTVVQAVAKDVMSHRLVLGFDAVADNITPAQVVERIIAMVPPPTPVWNASAPGQAQHQGQPAPGQHPQGQHPQAQHPQGQHPQAQHPQGQAHGQASAGRPPQQGPQPPQQGHDLQPDFR